MNITAEDVITATKTATARAKQLAQKHAKSPSYTKKGPGRYHKQGNDGDDTFRRLKGF